MPTGATHTHRQSREAVTAADIRLHGDSIDPHRASPALPEPAHAAGEPDTRVYVGDCRDVLANLPDRSAQK